MKQKRSDLNRRDFMVKTGAAALAALVKPFPGGSFAAAAPKLKHWRVALVGTGSRGTTMWGRDLIHPYKEYVTLVGLYDPNPKRADVSKRIMKTDAPIFSSFDEMIKKGKPNTVIVTTVDAFHYKYTVRAMELGCDVISEKPMATDEVQTQAILDAEKKYGKKVIVTFNARYGPVARKVKEILMSGVIGPIQSVDFHWYLDVYHGADYFRRWHAYKRFSGTLLVHKATHHFDLMNWWLDAEPEEVYAYGRLIKYGKNGTFRYKHCRGCPYKEKCPFYWDITSNKFYMDLYVGCEDVDGYYRDGCVFRKDIDIYDTMAVQVRYDNKIHMSYSLNAFMPYEGFKVGFNGLNGRLDVRSYQRQPWDQPNLGEIRLTKIFAKPGESKTMSVQQVRGEHAGADPLLKDMIFKPGIPDPLHQRAGSRAGAMSILIGIAARKSIEDHKVYRIHDLVKFT